MSQKPTEATEIELVNATHKGDDTDAVSISRWSKYGKDRIYMDGLKTGDGWISLKDGSSGGDRWTKVSAESELDGDQLTIEVGNRTTIHTITVRLHGEAFDTHDDSEDGGADDEARAEMLDVEGELGAGDNSEVATDGGTDAIEVREEYDDHLSTSIPEDIAEYVPEEAEAVHIRDARETAAFYLTGDRQYATGVHCVRCYCDLAVTERGTGISWCPNCEYAPGHDHGDDSGPDPDTSDDAPEAVTDGGEDPLTATETIEGRRTAGNPYSAADEGEPATATLTATAERSEFYDDGRQGIVVSGELATGEALVANSANRTQLKIDPDGETDLDAETFVADVEDIDALREQVSDALDELRTMMIEDLGPAVHADSPSRDRSGEGSVIRAEGVVETEDGRSLGVTWRNVHDAGFTVGTDQDDRGAFTVAEIDALVAFARDSSPITRRLRM